MAQPNNTAGVTDLAVWRAADLERRREMLGRLSLPDYNRPRGRSLADNIQTLSTYATQLWACHAMLSPAQIKSALRVIADDLFKASTKARKRKRARG